VPIVFLFLALATESQADGGTTALALTLVAEEIGIGLAVGLGLTALGTFLLKSNRLAYRHVPLELLRIDGHRSSANNCFTRRCAFL
jgi:hypothetical protein